MGHPADSRVNAEALPDVRVQREGDFSLFDSPSDFSAAGASAGAESPSVFGFAERVRRFGADSSLAGVSFEAAGSTTTRRPLVAGASCWISSMCMYFSLILVTGSFGLVTARLVLERA